MKRFLLLFCTVVLICSIMIVPAFAAETIVATDFNDYVVLPSAIPAGQYTLTFGIKSSTSNLVLTSEVFWVGEYVVDGDESGFITSPFLLSNDDDGFVSFSCVLTFVTVTDPVDGEIYLSVVELDGEYYKFDEDAEYVFILTPYDGIPVEPEPGSPIGGVLDVFSGIGSWITGQLSAATSLFWNATSGELTFLGILAVVGLAFAVIFLLIGIIQRFLQFRG